MTTMNKPTKGFWIISIIALLWNIMGVYQFLSSTLMGDELRQTLTEAQIALMDGLPSWYNIVFGIAVFAGLLGCILLLLRKKIAIAVFAVSLLTVLIMMGYWFLATDVIGVYGIEAVIMPMLVITIAIFLFYYSKGAARNGWIG